MSDEDRLAKKAAAERLEAPAVIERAIEAMRQHPQASSAADAIEKACEGRKFDVDAAVGGITPPDAIADEP